jgi:hypothetical protein
MLSTEVDGEPNFWIQYNGIAQNTFGQLKAATIISGGRVLFYPV